jgi:hypothetical protein
MLVAVNPIFENHSADSSIMDTNKLDGLIDLLNIHAIDAID